MVRGGSFIIIFFLEEALAFDSKKKGKKKIMFEHVT